MPPNAAIQENVMDKDDPKPKPNEPVPPTGQKDTSPEKEKPPHQFDDWALI